MMGRGWGSCLIAEDGGGWAETWCRSPGQEPFWGLPGKGKALDVLPGAGGCFSRVHSRSLPLSKAACIIHCPHTICISRRENPPLRPATTAGEEDNPW